MSLMRKTRLSGWYEYYRTPCPICGSTGGCMAHKDGNVVVCIREESDRPFSTNSALPSYLHYLKGEKRKKLDITTVEEVPGHQKLDNETLNMIYRTMIDCLTLDDKHYEHLISPTRQLTDEQIRLREYRSFPHKPWDIVKMIQEETGIDDFSGVPGFYLKDNQYWTIAGSEGILIPYRNEYNQILGFQYRIDNPPNVVEIKVLKPGLRATIIQQPNYVQVSFEGEIILEQEIDIKKEWKTIYQDNETIGWIRVVRGNRYFWLSSANKPEGTASGNPAPIHISVPTSGLNTWDVGELLQTDTAWISEGGLKTDIATDCIKSIKNIDTVFVALPGVGAWRLALPVLKRMGVKTVNMAFDKDALTNIHVKKHLYECVKQLNTEGYQVNMVMWNEEPKGIDDQLIQNKTYKLIELKNKTKKSSS